MATSQEIEALLAQVRTSVDGGTCSIASRYYEKGDGTKISWFHALLELNMTASDALQVVRNLNPADYRKGPIPDRDYPEHGDCIWVFKCRVKGKRVYIKLKVHCNTLILSFHENWHK